MNNLIRNILWCDIFWLRILRLFGNKVRLLRSRVEDSSFKVVLVDHKGLLLIDAERRLFGYSNNNSLLNYSGLLPGTLIE